MTRTPGMASSIAATLLLAAPAAAQEDAESIQVAMAASTALDLYCSDVAAGEGTTVAAATRDVATSLTDVSRAYDRSGEPYLLYWRGLLYNCIANDQQASSDLAAFVEGVHDQSVYAAQVRDAKQRMARIERKARGGLRFGVPAAPAIVAGVGLGVASGLLGATAGDRAAAMRATETQFRDDPAAWDQRVALQEQAIEQGQAATALLIGSLGSGVAALATVVVSGLVEGTAPRVRVSSVGGAPTPTGFSFGVELAW